MSNTEIKSAVYAQDTRYYSRICKFRDAEHRAKYMKDGQSLVAIANEDDAYMIADGYTLDEESALWKKEGHVDVNNNDAADLYEVIIPLQDMNMFYEAD